MFAKTLFFAEIALLVEIISCQWSGPYGPGLYYRRVDPSETLGAITGPRRCGIPSTISYGLEVSSASPITPTGVVVQTDGMVMEGPVLVTGKLPFLGAVDLEGPLPVMGQGVVTYRCGDRRFGIVNEVFPSPEITFHSGMYGYQR